MRLDLADRIDRHVHDNQQTGTAEEQRNARLCDHVFRQDTDDRQAKAKDKLAETYRLTEKLMDGKDWLVGDGPTVADNYLFVTLLWADKFDVDLPQSLVDYRERNKQRDAVGKAMSAEGLL